MFNIVIVSNKLSSKIVIANGKKFIDMESNCVYDYMGMEDIIEYILEDGSSET